MSGFSFSPPAGVGAGEGGQMMQEPYLRPRYFSCTEPHCGGVPTAARGEPHFPRCLSTHPGMAPPIRKGRQRLAFALSLPPRVPVTTASRLIPTLLQDSLRPPEAWSLLTLPGKTGPKCWTTTAAILEQRSLSPVGHTVMCFIFPGRRSTLSRDPGMDTTQFRNQGSDSSPLLPSCP